VNARHCIHKLLAGGGTDLSNVFCMGHVVVNGHVLIAAELRGHVTIGMKVGTLHGHILMMSHGQVPILVIGWHSIHVSVESVCCTDLRAGGSGGGEVDGAGVCRAVGNVDL
jgi:hypothetical protein